MVTLFYNCPGVKDEKNNIYDHIALFRDHEDPYTFWYINNHPRVTIDKRDNKPVFDFMVIGRGIKKEGTEEVQEGRLVISINLALTQDEMNAIEYTLKKFVEDAGFDDSIKRNYPNFDQKMKEAADQILLNSNIFIKKGLSRQFPLKNRKGVVTIKPVNFTDGKASINLGSSDIYGQITHETRPNLFGDCVATFGANFGAQETQILYEIFKPEKKKDKSVNLSAVANYEMTYNAMMPFKATVVIRYDRIYNAFVDKLNTHSGVDSKYQGLYILPDNLGNVNNSNCVYCNGADLYISKEDLDNYLHNTNGVTNNIEIKITDSEIGDANEKYEQMILDSVSKQATDKVLDMMFDKVAPLDPNDIDTPHDVETGYFDSSQTNIDGDDKKESSSHKKRNVVYDVCYKLKNNVNIEASNNYAFTIEKNKATEVRAYPNLGLELLLKDYSMDSMVRVLDASDIYFQNIKVPIDVDNANFGRDIAMISVRVKYKDKTGGVKMDKVFNFNEDNPNTQIFEVLMSRDNEGKLITKYYYQTKIYYRQFDIYDKNQREEDKWSDEKVGQGIGSPIYIHYVDMRNLCVNCSAGDVAWNEIDKLDVEFKYRDAPDRKGATKVITLTQDKPSDTWNCYMYKDNGFYNYRIHYFYRDGTDDWSEIFESESNDLSINDKLSGVFRVTFDINIPKSIEKIRVIVHSQDKEEYSGWFTQTETWTWETRMKEDREKTYQYKYQYYLVNGDETMKSSEWTAPKSAKGVNYVTETINLNVEKISLTIDGDSLDWKKWSRVYVHLKYDDDANNLHYDDENLPFIRLNREKSFENVIIPVMNNTIRPRIWVQYIPLSGDEVIPSDEVTITGTNLILLPNAAPPKSNPTTPAEDNSPNQAASASEGDSHPMSASEPASAPEPETVPVEKDIDLTFSVRAMDWEKWNGVWISIRYDDEANDIHYNDINVPPFKMSQNRSEDVTVTIHIKNPDILPKVLVKYISPENQEICSEETPVSDFTIVLPDAAPPK